MSTIISNKMTLKEVLDFFKTGYRMERETGISANRVIYWKSKGFLPIVSQLRIERATEGKLKAKIEDMDKRLLK